MKKLKENKGKILTVIIIIIMAVSMPINFQVGNVNFIFGEYSFIYTLYSLLPFFTMSLVVYFLSIGFLYLLNKKLKKPFENAFHKERMILLSILNFLILALIFPSLNIFDFKLKPF